MSQYPPQHNPSFLDLVWQYKFLLAFNIIFISCLSFVILYVFNAVPEELKVVSTNDSQVLAASQGTNDLLTDPPVIDGNGELPERIVIKKIGIDAVITNPAKSDNTTLNAYLLRGAVRYPGSGMLGKGNVFIFGHSTSLRIVNNQAYKAFNNLKQLNPEDEIIVESKDKEYVYKVFSVSLVDSDKELVDLGTSKNMLTLSTCNVFGQKQERYVVEALFSSVSNRSGV
jgi:LPXTG-site transpeptidase (sortase) family protein